MEKCCFRTGFAFDDTTPDCQRAAVGKDASSLIDVLHKLEEIYPDPFAPLTTAARRQIAQCTDLLKLLDVIRNELQCCSTHSRNLSKLLAASRLAGAHLGDIHFQFLCIQCKFGLELCNRNDISFFCDQHSFLSLLVSLTV